MKYRIIYDYKLTKLIKEYDYIQNLFPKHSLFIYKNYKLGMEKNINSDDYINIFIDMISEKMIILYPSKINILIVNEQYMLTNKYVRREEYIDKPLILIDDVINYYFCLTQFSYNYLINNGIDKKKLILLDGLVDTKIKTTITNTINLNKNKYRYVYYEIDIYSSQNNIILLETWLKYYVNSNMKLIIKYTNQKEKIMTLFKNLIKVNKLYYNEIYNYKNIIVFIDSKDLDNYYNNIDLVIINNSNFSLLYKLYQYILDKKYIITVKNEITDKILDKSQLFDSFSNNDLKKTLDFYFSLNEKDRLKNIDKNIKKLIKKSDKTIKELNKFFLKNEYI
jgi:hypothetical protein